MITIGPVILTLEASHGTDRALVLESSGGHPAGPTKLDASCRTCVARIGSGSIVFQSFGLLDDLY